MTPTALTPAQLRWLAHSAADTNTKLLLITTPGDQQPAHTLLTVLTNDLPHTQHLGTPDPDHRQPRTAIDRAEHHLAATSAASPDRNRAAQLLRQRNQVLAQLRDIANTTTRLDAIAEQDRARGRRPRPRQRPRALTDRGTTPALPAAANHNESDGRLGRNRIGVEISAPSELTALTVLARSRQVQHR